MPLSDQVLAGVTGSVVNGTSGDDVLITTADGSGGYSWVNGLGGNDIMIGSAGNDALFGGEGNDIVSAGRGDDVAVGDGGDDWINGGAGNDMMFGFDGNDTMAGGTGSDTAIGGEGDDTYVWATNQSGGDAFHGEEGTNTLEVQVVLNDWEWGGTSNQIRNTLEGGTFTVDSETKWELVDGQVKFEGPASGSFTMNGRTVEFTDVSVIKAYQF